MNRKELYEYIDRLLGLYNDVENIDQNTLLTFIKENKDIVDKESPQLVLIKIEYKYGLVKQGNDDLTRTWSLTKLGQKVLRHGSWTKYLYNKEDLIVKQITSSISTNKWQVWILIGTFLLFCSSLAISILSFKGSERSQEQFNELIRIFQSKDTIGSKADSIRIDDPPDSTK